ncbi:MAG: hypothetical protein HGB19_12090 [Chlorobiales bacterium]|nr:hypothetical protein [Chlorobiales bacterium]
MANILVFIEQRDGKIKRSSLEALSKAAELGGTMGMDAVAVLIGSGVGSAAAELGKYGAKKVFVFDHPSLASYASTAYARLVTKVAKEEGTAVVLMGATAMGKDLAPRVAVRLGAGLASDCVELNSDGGKLIARRYAYSGKVVATVTIETGVKVFSLRPNVFAVNGNYGFAGEVVSSAYDPEPGDLKSVVKEIVASAGAECRGRRTLT